MMYWKSILLGLLAAVSLCGGGCEKNRNRGVTVDGRSPLSDGTDTAPAETFDTEAERVTDSVDTESGAVSETADTGAVPGDSNRTVVKNTATADSDDESVENPQDAPVQKEVSALENTYLWKKGDKLDRVVRHRYGFPENKIWTDTFRIECIEDFVLKRNGLENKKKIPSGTTLVLPDRERLFVDVGFPEPLAAHLTTLFETETRYYELGDEAVERMCTEDQRFPKRLREAFGEMAERTAAFRSALEAYETPAGKPLKKVLEVLTGLAYNFNEVAGFKKYDESFCDFAGKEVTGTKRQFSNLMYRLYKWSSMQKASTEPLTQ